MNVWQRTIRLGHVFNNTDLTFEQRRDRIVATLERSGWAVDNPYVGELIDELGEAETPSDFNSVWSAIYDEADSDRVWIETIR